MKLELFFLAITSFLLYNTYYDYKFTQLLILYKKQLRMGGIFIISFLLYCLVKRDPSKNKVLLASANNIIKYLPIDKSSADFLTPILDLTNNNFMQKFNNASKIDSMPIQQQSNNFIKNNDGSINYKRSVSNIKKKMVAAKQKWQCSKCNHILSAHYEIDHIQALHKGGSNNIENLIALCRECHANKTALEFM